MGSSVRVADVTRFLHSTGQICDTNKEVLYTSQGCVVVPADTLSKFLKKEDVLVKYPRRGGLYVAKMKARAPKTGGAGGGKSGFTRQGGVQ